MGVIEHSAFPLLVGEIGDAVVQTGCKALSFWLVTYEYIVGSDRGFLLLYPPSLFPSLMERSKVFLFISRKDDRYPKIMLILLYGQ